MRGSISLTRLNTTFPITLISLNKFTKSYFLSFAYLGIDNIISKQNKDNNFFIFIRIRFYSSKSNSTNLAQRFFNLILFVLSSYCYNISKLGGFIMIITFNKIQWRNSADCDVFNMHAINSIELDTDNNIVTIVCATNTYKSPFYGLTYGGGITHLEFTAMHPYDFGCYIEIAIFESTNKVAVTTHASTVPSWFANKCKVFGTIKKLCDNTTKLINLINNNGFDWETFDVSNK